METECDGNHTECSNNNHLALFNLFSFDVGVKLLKSGNRVRPFQISQ